MALNHLGGLALLQDQYERAAELFRQSLSIYQRIEDRGGLFTAHHGLAVALTAFEDYDAAQQHLLQAAYVAAEVDLASWWLTVCEAAGEFFAATGAVERGAALVRLAQRHSESAASTRHRAESWLQEANDNSAPLLLDLDHVKQQLADEIAMHNWAHVSVLSPDEQTTDLVESLSARELEILRLLEAGLTNQDIADSLVLTLGTVKSHNYNIYSKLGVKSRSQAVRRAKELNLL